jgi:hypothetical protein
MIAPPTPPVAEPMITASAVAMKSALPRPKPARKPTISGMPWVALSGSCFGSLVHQLVQHGQGGGQCLAFGFGERCQARFEQRLAGGAHRVQVREARETITGRHTFGDHEDAVQAVLDRVDEIGAQVVVVGREGRVSARSRVPVVVVPA